jgi:hypothetical protein
MLDRLVLQLGDTSGDAIAAHAHLRDVIRRGTSADEQLRAYETARVQGLSSDAALRAVVEWAARTTVGMDAERGGSEASPRRMRHI